MTAPFSTRIRRPGAVLVVAAAACVALACATTHNYLDPAGPTYEGAHAPDARDRTCGAQDGALKVVTFNIEFAREIERAIALLRTSAALRDFDILLLQEMDEPGVQRIARALGLNYVYVPSTIHPQADHDFGTAVLSPWPLDQTRKLLLPHAAFITRARRAAASAIVHCGTLRIRAMAVHLPAPAGVSGEEREDQVRVMLADLAGTHGPVVVGGDFNSRRMGSMFTQAGYRWLTDKLPGTSRGIGLWWSNDHVFTRGFVPAGGGPSAGVVDSAGASDHRAVWVRVAIQNEK
jgi:endonuclease/exonuclease/phosphatase family metal-dependent hydrolase